MILIFVGLFNDSFGVMNYDILVFFGIEFFLWMIDVNWLRFVLIFMQGWFGFLYIFFVLIGVLQFILDDLYEVVMIDGVLVFVKLRYIMFLMVFIVMVLIIIIQFMFNFNNFNIIYLFNGGGLVVIGLIVGGIDIFVLWIYKLIMQLS